jgi:hypothetical protein
MNDVAEALSKLLQMIEMIDSGQKITRHEMQAVRNHIARIRAGHG